MRALFHGANSRHNIGAAWLLPRSKTSPYRPIPQVSYLQPLLHSHPVLDLCLQANRIDSHRRHRRCQTCPKRSTYRRGSRDLRSMSGPPKSRGSRPKKSKPSNVGSTKPRKVKEPRAPGRPPIGIIATGLTSTGQKYFDCVTDPRGEPAARCPIGGPSSGFMRRSAVSKVKATFDVVVSNTTGLGTVLINIATPGPTTDVAVVQYTSNATTFVATTATPLNYSTGTSVAYWTDGATYTGASALTGYQLLVRPVAAALYVTCTGSDTNQNGVMTMWENPGHMTAASQILIGNVVGNRNARVIRAVQTGDAQVANVLNWHPSSAWQTGFIPNSAITKDRKSVV